MAEDMNNQVSNNQQPQAPQMPANQPPMGAPNAPAGYYAQNPYGVPQGQPQGQPQPQPQPQPMPGVQFVPAPAPLMQLTGGMKFGWALVGIGFGLWGILLAWLVNADKMPQVKSDAIKFTVIGFVVNIGLIFLATLAIGGLLAASVAAVGNYATF